MGLYRRNDSPFWWMAVTGEKARSTGVLVEPNATAEIRKQQKQLAHDTYVKAMNDRAAVRHGLKADTTAITFSKFADWYDAHKVARHRGAEREREILAHLRAFFGPMPLAAIADSAVSEYETARLARKLSPRTVNREVALLKMMLAAAIPKYLTASPLKGRKLLRAPKRKKRVIRSAEEEARLLAELEPKDQALYIVAVDTLIRLGNVLDLRRDEDKGTHLELTDSKTGPYTAELSPRARAALDWLPNTGPYYFEHRRTAKTVRTRRAIIRRLLQRACERADIPYGRAVAGVTWHTATRATGATRLLRAGVDLRTVQGAGHWEDIRSVQEYLQTDDESIRAAVTKASPTTDLPAAMQAATERLKQRRSEQARTAGRASGKARTTQVLRPTPNRKTDR